MSQHQTLSQQAIDKLAMLKVESFEYSHQSQQFKIGGAAIDLLQLRDKDIFPVPESALSGQSIEQIVASSAVAYPARLYPRGNPIALPKMDIFLQDHWSIKLADEVTDVMRDVFEELHSEKLLIPRDDKKINYHLSPQGQGRFVLKTLGNCACMGADATARWFGAHFWDESISELTAHNIDIPAQRWSLLAGVGHLASRANLDTTQ